jgi:hypothetical protein
MSGNGMNQTPDSHEPDMVRVALRKLAAESRPPKTLPTAGQLWWRAEVARRLAGPQGEREIRPAVWGQTVGIVLAVLVLLLFFSLQASALMGLLAGREGPAGALLKMAVGLLPLAAVGLMGFLLTRQT